MKNVLVIMGSKSDDKNLEGCYTMLDKFDLSYEVVVASAHRNPEGVLSIAKNANKNYQVIIAAAGKAAHLPGVIAGHTILPVIGVPMNTSDLGGLDSLYSIVQMPKGVPVATVAINGSHNAAILAAQIIAGQYKSIQKKLLEYKEELKQG